MKTRTLVAMAFLAIVAIAAVWKVTRPDPHARKANAPQPLSLKKADIDELEVAEAGKPAVTLKKDGSAWKLVQPVADGADQTSVDQALDTLAELKLRDVIAESPESYEQVGLKASDITTVTPKKAGKPLATLIIGKTSNVRLGDDPRVYATANLKRWALVKEPKQWRDRRILDVPVDDIERVEVAYPDAKIVAKKEAPPAPPADAKADPKAPPPPPPGPGKWVVVEGADKIGGALDENVPLELASTVARLSAMDFVDDPKVTPASVGLEPPRATVTVLQKGGKASKLLVGKDEAEATYVKLADAPRIWKVQKWESDRIPGSPAQWRDKTLVRVEPASVTKIEVTKGTDRTVLERAGADKWKATTPANLGELDQGRVQAILRTTEALRASKVLGAIDPKTVGLDKPAATVTLWKKDGTQVKLALGAEKDAQTPLQLNGGKELYALPAHQAQPFVKASADFKQSAGGAGAAGHDDHPPPPPM